MAKARSNITHLAEYTASPLEDRVRLLEKRLRRTESLRRWQTSLPYRATLSAVLYVNSLLVLQTLLVPGTVAIAFVPVCCYWLSILTLYLVRGIYESRLPDTHKL